MVNVKGTPGAVVVELPKLLRMSLRTIPLEDNTLLTDPLTEFEPSEGYGPLVSVGSAMHAVVLLQELLDERLRVLTAYAIGGRPDKRQVGSPAQHESSRAGGDISSSYSPAMEVRRTATVMPRHKVAKVPSTADKRRKAAGLDTK